MTSCRKYTGALTYQNSGRTSPHSIMSVFWAIFSEKKLYRGTDFSELPPIESDLRSLVPADSGINVRLAGDPLLDSWRGGSRVASHASFEQICVTYEEVCRMCSLTRMCSLNRMCSLAVGFRHAQGQRHDWSPIAKGFRV